MLLRLPLQEPARLFRLARFAPSQAPASANTRLKTALALPTELRPLAGMAYFPRVDEVILFEPVAQFPGSARHTAHPSHRTQDAIRHKPAASLRRLRSSRRPQGDSHRPADFIPLASWVCRPTSLPHSQLARAERVGMPPPRFRQGQVPSSAFRSFRSSPSSLPRSLRTGSPNGDRQGSSPRLRCSTPPVTARRFAPISCAGPGGSGLHP